MDGIAYLIENRFQKDKIGQWMPIRKKREIYVSEENISRNEWFQAGRNGLKAKLLLKTASINYFGEEEIEYQGICYSIYRTYYQKEQDEIELYLEKKAGNEDGN